MASQPPPPAVPATEPPAERDDIPPNPFAPPELPEIRLQRDRAPPSRLHRIRPAPCPAAGKSAELHPQP